MDTDLRLLYATTHREKPQNVLCPNFLSISLHPANPFIYAVTFDPVRRVLVRLIPWKKSPKPPAE